MQCIKNLIAQKYVIFNVNSKKIPIVGAGWQTATFEELTKTHDFKNPRWGMRMGEQFNGRKIMCLDYDCCGEPVNGVREGCEYTKSRLKEYRRIGNEDGMYTSSTAGNMNVLVDYTDCPSLIARIGTKSKYKKTGSSLEILVGSGHQQVIPPTATICKISGNIDRQRMFLDPERPFLVLRENTPEYDFIMGLIDDAEPRPVPAKAPPAPAKAPPAPAKEAYPEAESNEDPYLELLMKVIGNNGLDWDTYFKIAGILKSNGYTLDQFLEHARLSSKFNYESSTTLWNGIKKNTMDIHGLQNIAKAVNPSGYAEWLKTAKTGRTADDDNQASQMILNDLRGLVFVSHANNSERVWMKQGHLWISDMHKIERNIKTIIFKSGISYKAVSKSGGQKNTPYTQNTSACKRVYEGVLLLIHSDPSFISHDLEEKLITSTKGKLCFEDGVLDIIGRRFTRWEDLSEPVYSTLMVPLSVGEYFHNPDRAVMQEVRETIYETLFHSNTGQALHYLSRALAGHNEDKIWATYMAERDCGKGVMFANLKGSFGDYVADFELLNIMYERTRDINEVSRKQYWLLPLERVRLAISQEVPENKRLKADSQQIKSICSGGDLKRARNNYDRMDTVFTVQASLFIMGNNELVVDEEDANKHRLQWSSSIQFVEPEFLAKVKEEYPDDPRMWSMFRVKDDTVKTVKVPSLEWRLATIMLIYEAYQPRAVQVDWDAEDGVQSNVSIKMRSEILAVIDQTSNANDMVLCTDVFERLETFPKKKIMSAMEQMGIRRIKCTKSGPFRLKTVYTGVVLKAVVEEDNWDEKNTVVCN